MASLRKLDSARWQAIVRRRGISESRTFRSWRAADNWTRKVEASIEDGSYGSRQLAAHSTIGDLIERYRVEKLPQHRGNNHRASLNILEASLGSFPVANLTPTIIADFRDQRQQHASASTTRKDIQKLRRLLTLAEREWGLMLSAGNPAAKVELPKEAPHRERRLRPGEYRRLLASAHAGRNPAFAALIRFAAETGIREGEIAQLEWRDVDLATFTLRVASDSGRHTKSGRSRIVPLTRAAARLLWRLKPQRPKATDKVFGYKSGGGIHQAFERIRKRAEIEGLHFHDLRHEAASRLALKLRAHELARVLGHSDLKTTMRYYHPAASDLVGKLHN